jgi:lipoyl(octanoyl) transferase
VAERDASTDVRLVPLALSTPALKWLGCVDYEPTWRAMQRRTDEATAATPDEIWFLEHPPVFTMGMNAKAVHLLAPGDIPVIGIERAIVATVAQWGIAAYGKRDAPGVYVGESKIASVGLRIRRGRSYHGLALNVAMDLAPFARINPCGYAGLQMTQLSDLGGPASVREVSEALAPQLLRELGFGALAERQSATSTWLQDVSSR